MLADVSEVRTASIMRAIVLMMEAVHTSETSVNMYLTTWQYIPEYSKLYTFYTYNMLYKDTAVINCINSQHKKVHFRQIW
jgi:hypothetical protein